MNKPYITVVMATYNQAEYLRQALDSLLVQTLAPDEFEIIVINDGSTDQTADILRGYSRAIRRVERENRGLVPSCNEGLALARGSYFARMDSDDFVAPEWLECLIQALLSNSKACCAYPDRYDVYGDEWHHVEVKLDNLYSLVACGSLFPTELLRKLGKFRSFYWEEYDLYLRLRQTGDFVHVMRPLYMYRRHGSNMTYSMAKRVQGWLELAREWGIETLQSAGHDPEMDKALQLLQDERRDQ